MVRLDKDSISKWTSLLPDDLKDAIASEPDGDEVAAERVSLGLKGMDELSGDARVERILDFVLAEQDAFVDMGRARRVRFLAWISRQPHSMPPKPMTLLLESGSEDDGDDETGRGRMEKVAPVFMQDLKAIMAALGPRVARGIVDSETLAVVTAAGYDVAAKSAPAAGGV